ncbi:MAG: amidase family protein [Negativicutes bacterium]|jgi:Asp-tRNA(Asn)/Glu-tRNA(Gln) amidotransferase A subunit family amidase
MNSIKIFEKIAKAALKAEKNSRKSVLTNNPQTLELAAKVLEGGVRPYLLGVKDTAVMPRDLIERLCGGSFIWHTLDKSASGGRAIDVDLLNPLTGRPMTGSSSGSAVNVLLGINDIALGTDGGGSVLAPALACNLFSVLLAGCGYKSNSCNRSTDGISFSSSVGIIAREWKVICAALSILELNDNETKLPIKIAVPAKANIILPDGSDMCDRLQPVIESLQSLGVKCVEIEFPDFADRSHSITAMQKILHDFDTVMTFEGPVDVLGFGDSVFGLTGPAARALQNKSGKYLVKIANMLDMTSVTLPAGDAAAGIVISTENGKENAARLFRLIDALAQQFSCCELHGKYFAEGGLGKSLIFS